MSTLAGKSKVKDLFALLQFGVDLEMQNGGIMIAKLSQMHYICKKQ
jgi:hypothetical protein